ncbi:HU family DNA-binding protein [Desulfosarcina cetonica]|uniref:HU family DNA-binding protein n=1 Tax=Desulfosarcina cetonica TaxID=90730 RepID=UPI003BEEC059
MNKRELIDKLRASNGLTKPQAQKAVKAFFQSITNALAEGDRVEIRGWCSFSVKDYPAISAGIREPVEKLRSNRKSCRFAKSAGNSKRGSMNDDGNL